jgi:4-aminobutyrate aminotransferase-like enzyme/Ser/Thr protein kinase RdoA (MazF antagonist)
MTLGPVAISAEHFGVIGTATPLPGYTDENWRIETAGGDVYVLKVSADSSTVSLQNSVLEAITLTSYRAPRVVATAVLDDGSTARLLTWVEGTASADANRPPETARAIGVAAGQIVNALASLEGGAPDEARDWDLASAADTIRNKASAIAGERKRVIVYGVADLLDTVDFASLPQQVIHNDLNDDNVLVANGEVVGVIDVGDTLRTARIAEAAIAAAYAIQDQEDPLSLASDLIEGFASVVEVTAEEAAVIWPLIMGRLATSVVKSASGPRDNPHRLKSEAGGWDLLERFQAGDDAVMRAELSAAAGHPAPDDGRIALIERREQALGPSLSLSYAEPINVVRGSGTYLFDERGRRYLDCVNNVAHVGHSHPAVVAAASRQAAILNTNTRYLHDEVLRYANRLAATMPDGLDVVFLTNSGSEANELAIRLIRAATGNHDLVCLDGGYHGNTTTLVAVSPYKYPTGAEPPPGIHVLPSPDPRRRRATGLAGVSNVAGLIAEAIQGSGGQIMPAPGVLANAYGEVRDRGGLVIADEVQTGFGRVGSEFWAFELHTVMPDVVTLGKPMGNGHPVGAVVTTRGIAGALDMEYFNTFGGNPVSAAVANAVLDVIESEGLQANAAEVGSYLLAELASLAARHPQIADVRGVGLFLGVELVSATFADHVVEHAKNCGVLLSADGVDGNVLKIKPPLVFSERDADTVVATIDAALTAR